LFIEQLELDDMGFDTKSSKTFVEYHISEIDKEKKEGGNIDILIRDKKNRYIIIENKIHAPDQENQLKRYHNFLKKQHKDSRLLYLNLFGNDSKPKSIDDLKEKKDYFIITYQSNVLKWLERCLKESVNMPVIREIIQQYINVIKKITNQKNSPMNVEVVKLATKSSKNVEVVSRIVECFDDVKQKILTEFWKEIYKKLCEKLSVQKNNDYETYYRDKKVIIRLWVDVSEKKDNQKLCWSAAIDESFFTGFYICDDANNKLTIAENEFTNIVNYLTERGYRKETDVLGWKHSHPKLNFKEFNSSEIFALANPDELKNIVNKIVEDAFNDIKEVKKLWNNTPNLSE